MGSDCNLKDVSLQLFGVEREKVRDNFMAGVTELASWKARKEFPMKETPGAWIDTSPPKKQTLTPPVSKMKAQERSKKLPVGHRTQWPIQNRMAAAEDADRSKVPCYWFNEGPKGCLQGSKCPFLHVKSSQTVKPRQEDIAATISRNLLEKKNPEEEKK